MDPGYRRLKYTRYADDHILGFIGPKAEAGEIKARLAEFLRETLGLELNQDKTLITHARTQRARFLGYDISVALFKTPCDREEEKTPGGIECIFIGRVRTAVVGVEYLPVLEVSDKSLDWRPE